MVTYLLLLYLQIATAYPIISSDGPVLYPMIYSLLCNLNLIKWHSVCMQNIRISVVRLQSQYPRMLNWVPKNMKGPVSYHLT